MPRYAIISGGIVQNVVIADGPEDLPSFPEIAHLSDDSLVEIGCGFSEGVFTPAPAAPVDPMDAALQARVQRNTLLVELVDPYVMNPLRWADLSAEQQGEIAAYRRALLDITDQPGFPLDIAWPEFPTFM
jgi:hypothetical protein